MDPAPDLAANRDRTQRIATTAPADSAVRLTISHSLMRAVLWSPRKLITGNISLPETHQQTALAPNFLELCPAARDPTFYRAMAPYIERFFFADEDLWMYRELLKYQTQLRALIIRLDVGRLEAMPLDQLYALISLLMEGLIKKCRLLRQLQIELPPIPCHEMNYMYAWSFMDQAADKIHHLTVTNANQAGFVNFQMAMSYFPRLRSLTLLTSGSAENLHAMAQYWYPAIPASLHSLSLKLTMFDEYMFDLLEPYSELRKLSLVVTVLPEDRERFNSEDRERIKQKGARFRGLEELEVLSIQVDMGNLLNCYFFLESLTRGGAGQSLTKLILHVPHSIHWDREINVYFHELPRLRCFTLHLSIPAKYSGKKLLTPLLNSRYPSASVTSFTVTGLTYLDTELADNLAKVFPALTELNIRALDGKTYLEHNLGGDVVVELVRLNRRLRVLRFIDDYPKRISLSAIRAMADRSNSLLLKMMHEMRFPVSAQAHAQMMQLYGQDFVTDVLRAILKDAKWFRLY